MPPISRRRFLAASAAVVVAELVATGCSDDGGSAPTTSRPTPSDPPTSGSVPPTTGAPPATPPTSPATPPNSAPAPTTTTTDLSADPFTLGVASGDPDASSVVLWTRLAPEPLAGGGMPDESVEVVWETSADEDFARVEDTGTVVAEPRFGHSVHVTVPVGADGRWYRFRIGEWVSPTGWTRSAPTTVDGPVRFASASCQNFEDGFYTAHRDLAAQQPDFVVWVGDYIYEGGAAEVGVDGHVRTHAAPEIRTIAEYRDRYALYRSDADLRAAHAACPWFVVWDDHEVENNYAGLDPQDPADTATFATRRRDAYQVWWEHMPVRLDPPADDPSAPYPIHRAVRWGDLLHVLLLDTRQYRSDQTCGDGTLSLEPPCPETFGPDRTLLGAEQEAWLFEQLAAARDTVAWNVLAQQVVMTDLTFDGAIVNYDQWDGYPAQRTRVLERLAADQVPDVVVLTGDIHLAGVGTLRPEGPGVGTPVGVEFVATSISSGGLVDPGVADLVRGFPDVVDAELEHRGYILHTVTAEQWSAEYRMVETVKEPDAAVYVYRTYLVDRGSPAVRFADV